MPFQLETRRLLLREMTPDDLEIIAAMLGDAEVMRFYPKVLSRAEAAQWINRQIDRYRHDGHGLWLVIERATGEPVGQVGLVRQIVDGVAEREIGYMIHRPYWRRGYASEAAAAVRDHAFNERGEPRVISLIQPVNIPSQGVARALRMTIEKSTVFADIEHLVFALRHG